MDEAKAVDLSRAKHADDAVLETITELFQYQPWDTPQIESGRRVRDVLMDAYATIINEVPVCPTRTRALNMLVDCRMLANAAITHKGKF